MQGHTYIDISWHAQSEQSKAEDVLADNGDASSTG
jgi:hypothetical protein